MSKLHLWGMSCLVSIFCALAVVGSTADTFTTIKTFYGHDGSNPYGTLVQGWRGNLYGTTSRGGANHEGTVFHITSNGTGHTLYSFCSQPNCADGANPVAGLVQATNGTLYGTTAYGGTGPDIFGDGTVFKITPSGTLTTLYSFCSQPNCTDGYDPQGGLMQATNGTLYGTTFGDGTGTPGVAGTIFEITPGGSLTTLYSFCSQPNCTDGANPLAGLVQATDGNFYGTTWLGGTDGLGTVFKITPAGTLTTLYHFCSQPNCTDGYNPNGLVQATDGNFYGTTLGGGPTGSGTIFKITPTGTLTTLHSFCLQPNCTDGGDPEAALVQATDGNFYGTTLFGGTGTADFGGGTVFKITPTGTLTTLYSFCPQLNCSDGYNANGLMQATDGNFYGTAEGGGTSNEFGSGTVFSLATGLGPFVTTLPSSGMVGRGVKIFGNNLTATTNVAFNGTPATFTVVSDTELTTTVPTGATTGKVEVTTASGSLSSNVDFRVRP